MHREYQFVTGHRQATRLPIEASVMQTCGSSGGTGRFSLLVELSHEGQVDDGQLDRRLFRRRVCDLACSAFPRRVPDEEAVDEHAVWRRVAQLHEWIFYVDI